MHDRVIDDLAKFLGPFFRGRFCSPSFTVDWTYQVGPIGSIHRQIIGAPKVGSECQICSMLRFETSSRRWRTNFVLFITP